VYSFFEKKIIRCDKYAVNALTPYGNRRIARELKHHVLPHKLRVEGGVLPPFLPRDDLPSLPYSSLVPLHNKLTLMPFASLMHDLLMHVAIMRYLRPTIELLIFVHSYEMLVREGEVQMCLSVFKHFLYMLWQINTSSIFGNGRRHPNNREVFRHRGYLLLFFF
jgi:hypothetical protein